MERPVITLTDSGNDSFLEDKLGVMLESVEDDQDQEFQEVYCCAFNHDSDDRDQACLSS